MGMLAKACEMGWKVDGMNGDYEDKRCAPVECACSVVELEEEGRRCLAVYLLRRRLWCHYDWMGGLQNSAYYRRIYAAEERCMFKVIEQFAGRWSYGSGSKVYVQLEARRSYEDSAGVSPAPAVYLTSSSRRCSMINTTHNFEGSQADRFSPVPRSWILPP